MKQILSPAFLYTGLLLGALLGTMQCGSPVAGSEVQNERAVVYMPGGREPAAFARVQAVPVDHQPGSHTQKSRVFETLTDKQGVYSFSDLPSGYYNFLADKDSLAAFLDSIHVGDTLILPSDTLEQTGTFTAQVIMESNHDPRTVIVQVLGTTSYYSNVDDSGFFTIPDFPKGSYQLRLETTLPDYTPAIVPMIIPVQSDTISQIKMIYTGIPVVEGLKAIYDPLSKKIVVSWEPVDYEFGSGYVVYRDDPHDPNPSPEARALVKEPIFYDDMKDLIPSTGSTTARFRYRVAVLNSAMITGETFGYAACEALLSAQPPSLFATDTLFFHPNQPCTIHVEPRPTLGEIVSYRLSMSMNPSDQFIEFDGPDTIVTLSMPKDTIVDSLFSIVRIRTVDGLELTDTLWLRSRLSWNKRGAGPVTDAIGYHCVVSGNRMLLFTETEDAGCMLWSSSDGVLWSEESDSLPFTRLSKPPLVVDDNILVFDRDPQKRYATILTSEDGIKWTSRQIESLPNRGYSREHEVWTRYNDRIYLINYYPPCLSDAGCDSVSSWSSAEGLVWRHEWVKGSTFLDIFDAPTKYFTAVEYNGLLAVGGAWRSPYLSYPSWSAYAVRLWDNTASDPLRVLFPPSAIQDQTKEFFPKLISFDNRLFLTAEATTQTGEHHTRLWVLRDDYQWYLCSDSLPASSGGGENQWYHAMCVFQDRLYSISNEGVWVIER